MTVKATAAMAAGGKGGTHFNVVIRAAAFNGMTRVARSRAVHAVLDAELAGGVHALALDIGGVD